MDITLDEVAQLAGVGIGTIYRRYANKQELIAQVQRQYVEEFAAAIELASANPDSWQGLRQLLEYAGQQVANSRAYCELLSRVREGTKLFDFIQKSIDEPLTMLLGRAKESGHLRPDVEASDIYTIIIMIGPVVALTHTAQQNNWRRYLALTLDGICATTTPRRPLSPAPLSITDLFRPET